MSDYHSNQYQEWHPDVPRGCRFLYQNAEAPDRESFQKELERIFGRTKAQAAIIRSGTMRGRRPRTASGFRSYIPSSLGGAP